MHYLVVALPHSDAIFVKAYPAETAEAFCEGHVAAFAFFGGIPVSVLYDNTRLAVAANAELHSITPCLSLLCLLPNPWQDRVKHGSIFGAN